MPDQRIAELQEELNDLYEQLAGKRRAKRLAAEEETTRIEQQIRLLLKRIAPVEQEFVRRQTQQIVTSEISEADAETAIATIVHEVEIIEAQPAGYPDEVLRLLQEILGILKDPKLPVTGKLKTALPIVPGIVTYEVEGDVESVVRRLFPTFVKLGEAIVARKK